MLTSIITAVVLAATPVNAEICGEYAFTASQMMFAHQHFSAPEVDNLREQMEAQEMPEDYDRLIVAAWKLVLSTNVRPTSDGKTEAVNAMYQVAFNTCMGV